MVYLLVTIDTESQKVRIENRLRHVDYTGSIEEPVRLLLDLGDSIGLKYSFFLPLGELLPDYPQVVDLLEQILLRGHDIQAHLHLPFPRATETQIADWLGEEVRLFGRYAGYQPIAIRAGGYAVGKGSKWINAILSCGFRIDSSVWAGANTETTMLIYDEQKAIEEGWWGPGALEFDFRGAPLGGAYFCQSDNLARIGDSSLLELPISMREYDELNPWQYKFDPQWQDGARLVRMFRSMAAAENEDCDLYLNMSWHSEQARFWDSRVRRLAPGGEWLNYPLPPLRSFLNFVRKWRSSELANEVQSVCLRDIEPDEIKPCVFWARYHAEYWQGQPGVREADNSVMLSEVANPYQSPYSSQVGDIPIILKRSYIPEARILTMPQPSPNQHRSRRSLWVRIRNQQPVADLIAVLITSVVWLADVVMSMIVVLVAILLTPLALWILLRSSHHAGKNSITIPAQRRMVVIHKGGRESLYDA